MITTGFIESDFRVPKQGDKQFKSTEVLFFNPSLLSLRVTPSMEEVATAAGQLGYRFFFYKMGVYRIQGDTLVKTEWSVTDVAW
jgi:hypothetical protein